MVEGGQMQWDGGNGPGEAKRGTSEACSCGVSGSLGLGLRVRLPSGGAGHLPGRSQDLLQRKVIESFSYL